MSNEFEGVDIDIGVTLKVGVIWRKGDSRYVVLRHVYGEKPRWKYVGPALRHVWKTIKANRTFCTRCALPHRLLSGERYCRRQTE